MHLEIRSEFAAVEVSLDSSGNAPRLLLRDRETGRGVSLDAFVLHSLCLASGEVLEGLCRGTVPVEPPPPGAEARR